MKEIIAKIIKDDDLLKFKELSQANPSIIKEIDEHLCNTIHFASNLKALNIVSYLIEECGIDPYRVYTINGDTALNFALFFEDSDSNILSETKSLPASEDYERRHVNLVKMLLTTKKTLASEEEITEKTYLLFYDSFIHKKPLISLVLAKANANIDRNEALFRSTLRDLENENMSRPPHEKLKPSYIKGDLSIFHLATCFQSLPLMKYLIEERNIDIENKDNSIKSSPLRIAIRRYLKSSVEFLLGNGAIMDINFAKLLAQYHLLQKKEISIDIQDKYGRTALHIAANRWEPGLIYALLKAKANPNILDKDGCSPLTIAVMKNESEHVEYLLQFEANTELFSDVSKGDHSYETTLIIEKNKKIKKGEKIENIFSPFHTAIAQENWQIADLFIKYDEILKDIPGSNLLHFAALYNCHKAAEALIEKGQDMTAVDSKGRTPLDLARERGHDDFVQAFANKNIKIEDHNEKILLSPRSSPFSPKKDAERVLN